MRRAVVVALAVAIMALGTACDDGDDAGANGTATVAPNETPLKSALIAPEDLPGDWIYERTSEDAPQIGCSGPPPEHQEAYSAVLREEPSTFEFLIQAVLSAPADEATAFIANLPCANDDNVSRIPLEVPDGIDQLAAFRVVPREETLYEVSLVFLRRGSLVSYFNLQYQPAGELDLAEVTRMVAEQLTAASEAIQ